MIRLCIVVFVLIGLSACVNYSPVVTTPSDEDGLRDIIPTDEPDYGPDYEVDMSSVPDAVPRYEERRKAGNYSPYKVSGEVYRVMESVEVFSEVGMASWYGNKFHGNKTSNGEVYDMYAMSAAHKTLPLPSYVRVTNLANNKSVVVRVNDRGPFAHGRIIDLSYAAAQRLGYIRTGTTMVKIEYIHVPPSTNGGSPVAATVSPPPENNAPAKVAATEPVVASTVTAQNPAANTSTQMYLQVGSFSDEASASTNREQISGFIQWPVKTERGELAANKIVHRVLVGPLPNDATLDIVKQALIDAGFTESLKVTR